MRKIILTSVFISLSALAEDCSSDQVISGQGIIEFAESKCLTADLGKEVIAEKLAKTKSTKKFCKSCNNHLLKMSIKAPEEVAKTKSSYGDATMGELQKELSLITVDLLKVRSTFNIGLEPVDALKSCNFNNVKIPSCLMGKEATPAFADFQNKIKAAKNTMATEMGNLLSQNPNFEDGLFKRTSLNSCHLKDNEIFFAQMRYEESLLTPNFIQQLKKIIIKKNQAISDSIEDALNSGTIKYDHFRSLYTHLSQHPLFRETLRSQDNFQHFLESLNENDTNEKIVEKLYQSESAKGFGLAIAQRCSQAMMKTTDVMEKVYCEVQKPYVADDSRTMGLVNQEPFITMKDHEVESNLQRHCALLNNQTESDQAQYTSFNDVLKINEKNDPSLFSLPLKQFKTDAYNKLVANEGEQICRAKSEKSYCSDKSNDQACKMKQYLEQTDKKSPYQDLAHSFDPKINEILRGMIGDGLPQINGKPDQVAMTLLQQEGILPGGHSIPVNSTVRDVTNFHKMVAAPTNNHSAASALAPRLTSNEQSFKTETAPDEINENSPSSMRASSSKMVASAEGRNTGFSHLTDNEQKKVLSYLKGHKDPKTNTAIGFDEIPKFDSTINFADAPTPVGSELLPQHDQVAKFSGTSFPAASTGSSKTDGAGKVSAQGANEIAEVNFKTGPSNGSRPQNPTLNISKGNEGINEIKISVADEELKKTLQFKEKLKELLASRRKDLSQVEQKEKIIIKLNEHEIVVRYNKSMNQYEVFSKDQSVPKDYISTISYYFNYTMKEGPGKRETLINILKLSHNLKTK